MFRAYSIYEQNFAHFKFLSQHFHKSIALTTEKPELKGIKAHDRFARLLGWDSLNDIAQFLKGHDKRLPDFGKFDKDRIRYVYSDLYPDISVKKLLRIYYDFFEFSYTEGRPNSLSFETLRRMKSFSFFPKDPKKDLGDVADFLTVALESFSFLLNFERGIVDRNLLNSAIMLYFDFYDKDLISDFDWQDIADLTHPNCYHDAFIKYKTQLKPTFSFISSADYCYDKITYYTNEEHLLSSHKNLCHFISKIQNKNFIPQADREQILFNRVYQKATHDGFSTVSLTNSFEVNKDKVYTFDDFDFSQVKLVTKIDLDEDDSEDAYT